MEIKETLLTPKTKFEMRANLPAKEPLIQKKWLEEDLYEKILAKNQDHQPFILHDGPPYANGDIHVGHALNKILKDFVLRYKAMAGFYTPYIPGWDTHGLPIETALTKKGVNRKEMSVADFREKCYQYALIQVDRQKDQFMRLGTISDFKHIYRTLDRDFEAEQIKVFSKMAVEGLIYKGLKPVYWSPSSESALAEAEIEYHDVTSTSIYVAFKVQDTKGILNGDEQFIIWTTTPWTIPANLGICLNPTLTYGVYETTKGVFIFLQSLKEKLSSILGFEITKERKTFQGHDLVGITAKHPFYDRNSLVIDGDHVTAEAGTGCVHTAPGHGADDFIVGQKYNLEVLCPVDGKGVMTEEAGADLQGLFYEDANGKVIEMLQATHALLKQEKITHSYPHDWRTNKPIIFRATKQWFASIDEIREPLLEEIKKVTWYPKWGELRLHNMIKDRGDWCISRQRAWGVPIPIIYNEDETPIMEEAVFNHIADLFKEHSSNIWFKLPAKDLLPDGYTNPHSPHGNFVKETDIMDVWFDSGSSFHSVLPKYNIAMPADLYLEGSDQYRGWFNSSLIISTAVYGHAPYRNIVSHGFVLDGKGNKMSKSLGNVVDPNKVCSQYGAEILRLAFASVDYQSDVRMSDDLLKQVSETYRKIRNTFRFLLGNLNEKNRHFDYENDHATKFELVDEFLLAKLDQVTHEATQTYEEYNFASAVQSIVNFMTVDLSSFYLDICKDILYCDPFDSLRRRQVQTVLYNIFQALIRLLAPILPHTMEELYLTYDETGTSVHLLDMVKDPKEINESVLKEYELVLTLRDDVLKALEEARASGIIGSSQEALVHLVIEDTATKAIYDRLSFVEQNRLFIVSDVHEGESVDGLKKYQVSSVAVAKHDGVKCERCWNRFEEKDINEQGVCHRCDEAMKRYEQELA